MSTDTLGMSDTNTEPMLGFKVMFDHHGGEGPETVAGSVVFSHWLSLDDGSTSFTYRDVAIRDLEPEPRPLRGRSVALGHLLGSGARRRRGSGELLLGRLARQRTPGDRRCLAGASRPADERPG